MITIAEALTAAREVEREGFDRAFEVLPDELYPSMLQLIASETMPIVDGGVAAAEYARRLANIRKSESAIADAMLPYGEEFENDVPRRAARAQVLELARLWFEAELHATLPPNSVMAVKIVLPRVECHGCYGARQVEAGNTGIHVDCPVCQGAGNVRQLSRWRQ